MKKSILISLGVVLFALPAFSKTNVSFSEDGSFHVLFKDQITLEGGEKPKAAEKLYRALPVPKEDSDNSNHWWPKKTWQSEDGHRPISCSVEVFRCPGCTYFTCGVVVNAGDDDQNTIIVDGELETILDAQDSENLYKVLQLTPEEHPSLKHVLTKEVVTEDDIFQVNCHKSESTFKENGSQYLCRMLIKWAKAQEKNEENK